MEDFYIMKNRNKIAAFLLAGALAVGHGSVVYADVVWDLCAMNEERMRLGIQEKNIADNHVTNDANIDVEKHETPQSTSEYADIGIASVLNYVNLRAEPSVESEALGKLYNNSAATVLETVTDEAGEEWYLVSSGSVENAYVKAEYIKVGDEDLARGVSTRYATVTTTTLFVRTEPGTEASVLTMLPEGEDVVVYDALEEYGWYRVSTEEGLGYVSGEYVTIRTEFRVAESKEEEKERLEREEAERQAAAAAAEAARKAREEEERKAAEAARRAEETAKKAEETARKTQKEAAGKAQAEAAGKAQEETAKTAAQQSSEKTQQQTQNAQQAQQKKDKVTQTVSNGQAVVNYADRFVGNPYVYGGSSLTNGADCSGFVMSVYQAFGISLPHSSSALRSVGYGVSLSEIQPGDIVCYSGHVGIYAGNNTLLHASSPSTGIKYTSPVTYREILAIRRIF
ncbi:MAG TPA: hydrolase Nlp/P60 [Roseburia sp.]|nr:hydrolase Nlp/P60 [Roseburia sp.]